MKIEAGKYYKTRDGRKVGPITTSATRGWPWEVNGGKYDSTIRTRWAWRDDGSFQEDETHTLDLIAEWTDGPAFTVGAKVRVTSDAYGKEQLGKTGRVVEVGRSGSLDIEIEYDEPLIHANGLKRNQYRSDDLELIPDGPVRTVTRREVVEGVYAHVAVCPHEPGTVLVGFANPYDQHFRAMTASELKAAAAVLLELAGVLSDGE
jgi:hypothetical protein